MQLDICAADAPSVRLPDARGPPIASLASCDSYTQNPGITIKAIRGGFRANATGGLRSPPGGRPRKAVELPPSIEPHWYVVRARHGQTSAAEREIRDAGFEVVTAQLCHPATKARRSVSGSLVRAQEEWFSPLFTRYVIVRLNLADPAWRAIVGFDSVERIISGGHLSNGGIGVPLAIRDIEIEHLREILSPAGVWFAPGYRARTDDEDPIEAGTRLRLTDEVMGDYDGVCAMSDGQRVTMLMGWFNRDNTPTTVAQSAVITAI